MLIPEQRIRDRLLLIRERGIQGAERGGQFLHVVRMQLREFSIGLHGFVGILRRQFLRPVLEGLVGLLRVVAHRLRKGIPLLRLLRGDLKLRMQLVDSLLYKVRMLLRTAGRRGCAGRRGARTACRRSLCPS